MPQDLEVGFAQITLGQLGVQPVLLQQTKHDAKVAQMLFRSAGHHQGIVDIHQHKLSQVWRKDAVHHALEGGRCVGETKTQHLELEVTQVSGKRSLLDILRCYADLMTTALQVKRCEDAAFSQLIKQVINPRQRETVTYSDFVECSVIDAHTQRAIFLLHKKRRSTVRVSLAQ
jgi:hypothetical protein